MQKRIEMYDKLLKKIDENITATKLRINQVDKYVRSDDTNSYGFITELKTEVILWNDIRKEIEVLKKSHKNV